MMLCPKYDIFSPLFTVASSVSQGHKARISPNCGSVCPPTALTVSSKEEDGRVAPQLMTLFHFSLCGLVRRSPYNHTIHLSLLWAATG